MIGKGASIGPKGWARQNITSADSSLPAAGSGLDCSGFQYALLYIKATGGGSFDLTPYYYRSAHSAYIAGEKNTGISGTAVLKIEVDGSSDVFFYVDNYSGTVSDIDIEYQFMNRT